MRRLTAILSLALSLAGALVMIGGSSSYAAADPDAYMSAETKTARVITGSDRYETAVLVSQAGFPEGAPAVVITRGDDFADALCSAPLAHAYGGPLLLTPRSGLPGTVISELRRLHPSQVFVVGTGDGSSPLLAQIKSAVGQQNVTTLIGRDRYETAAMVADHLSAKTGRPDKVVIAPGDSFADALAVGPLAAVNHWPILYTPQYGSIPRVTLDAMAKLGVKSALEVGTYAHLDLPNVVRKVGVDRYETCALIADYAASNGLSAAHVAFATGLKFPDGLAAAPYLALDKGLLLLAEGAAVSTPVAQFLEPRSGGLRTLEAIGLAEVPSGAWLTQSQTPDPPLSGQDDTVSEPETTQTRFRPRPSTTTTEPTSTSTTASPVATTPISADPATQPPTTTTTRPPTTVTTRPPTTTTAALPTTTTTTAPASGGQTPRSPLTMSSNQTYSNLAVDATGATVGLWGQGLINTRVANVSVRGGTFGMKVGSGALSSALSVNGLTLDGATTALLLANVHNSSLTDVVARSPRITTTNQYHAFYIERDVVALTVRDSTFRGGSGYTVHLWHESGDLVSKDITFENCVIDARSGRYPLVIGPGFDNIRFLNCTFYGGSTGPIVTLYGGSNILIDGFTASGGSELVVGGADSAIIRNGTYHGPQIGTASNVTLSNVSLD